MRNTVAIKENVERGLNSPSYFVRKAASAIMHSNFKPIAAASAATTASGLSDGKQEDDEFSDAAKRLLQVASTVVFETAGTRSQFETLLMGFEKRFPFVPCECDCKSMPLAALPEHYKTSCCKVVCMCSLNELTQCGFKGTRAEIRDHMRTDLGLHMKGEILTLRKIVTETKPKLSRLENSVMFPCGSNYEGSYDKSLRFDGHGRLQNLQKNFVYEGEFSAGTMHGEGEYTTNLFKYKGSFSMGEFQGYGEYEDFEKGAKYKGNFCRGEGERRVIFDGPGTLVLENGTTYDGIFKEGIFFEGKATCATGTVDEGKFRHDRDFIYFLHGQGSRMVDDDKLQGNYENNQANGTMMIQKNGCEFYIDYVNGTKHGNFTALIDGDRIICKCEDDEILWRNGDVTIEYANGAKYQGQIRVVGDKLDRGTYFAHGYGTMTQVNGDSVSGVFSKGVFAKESCKRSRSSISPALPPAVETQDCDGNEQAENGSRRIRLSSALVAPIITKTADGTNVSSMSGDSDSG